MLSSARKICNAFVLLALIMLFYTNAYSQYISKKEIAAQFIQDLSEGIVNHYDAIKEVAGYLVEYIDENHLKYYEAYLEDGEKIDPNTISFLESGGEVIAFEIFTDPTGALTDVMKVVLKEERDLYLRYINDYIPYEYSAPVAGTPKKLYAKAIIDGTVYIASIEYIVRQYIDVPQFGNGYFIEYRNLQIEPNSFPQKTLTGLETFKLLYKTKVGDQTSGIVNLPSVFKAYRKKPLSFYIHRKNSFNSDKLWPYVQKGLNELKIYVFREVLFGGTEWIGTFTFTDENPNIPKAPIIKKVESGPDYITVSWEPPTEKPIPGKYRLYRSSRYPVTKLNSKIITTTTSLSFTDHTVIQGKDYYYAVSAITTVGSDEYEGNVSQSLKGNAHIRYFLNIEKLKNLYATDRPIEIQGTVEDNFGQKISGCNVFLSSPKNKWSNKNITTDEQGKFSFQVLSSTKEGVHYLYVNTQKNNSAATKKIFYNVLDSSKIRDVSIVNFTSSTLAPSSGQTLTVQIKIKNNCPNSINNQTCKLELKNLNGDLLDFKELNYSLNGEETKTLTTDLSIPANPENELLQLIASCDVEKEKDKTDNFARIDLFKGPTVDKKTYKLGLYENQHIDEPVTINSNTIVLTNASYNEGTFLINDTKSVTIQKDSMAYLEDDDLMIIYHYAGAGDTLGTFSAGASYDFYQSPVEITKHVGNELVYTIKVDNYVELKNEFMFYHDDANKFSGWAPEISSLNNNEKKIILHPSENEKYGRYKTWLRLDATDLSTIWVCRLYNRLMPLHKLTADRATLTNLTLNEQVSTNTSNIPGDEFHFTIMVDNNSSIYFEDHINAFFQLTKGDSVFKLTPDAISLKKNETGQLETRFSTFGISQGSYLLKYRITASYDDIQPITGQVNLTLIDNPELEIEPVDTTNVFDIGEIIPSMVKIKYKGTNNYVDDVRLFSKIIDPAGREIEKKYVYDASKKYYKTSLPSNYSGIYYISLSATKNRAKSANLELKYTVKSNFTVVPVFRTSKKNTRTYVNISIAPIGDLNGVGFDLVYDPTYLRFVDAVPSGVFQQDGTQTTFMKTKSGDRVIIGYSRLGNKGINSNAELPLASFEFETIKEGKTTFRLENIAAFNSKGDKIIGSGIDSSMTIEDFSVGVQATLTNIKPEIGELDTLFISLTNPINITTLGFDLRYNPKLFQFYGVNELKLFNENGTVNTALIANDNNGVLNVGLTQLSSKFGINESGKALAIIFKTINIGEQNFNLKNVVVSGPNTNIKIKTKVYNTKAQIGDYQNTTANLFFDPSKIGFSKGDTFYVDLKIEKVYNLNAVALDIDYNPNLVEYLSSEEGNFLNENGKVSTSFIIDNSETDGKLICGLSRLSSTEPGPSTTPAEVLFKLKFLAKNVGSGDLKMSNIGLLSPDGTTNYDFTYNNAAIHIYNSDFDLIPLSESDTTKTSAPKFEWEAFETPFSNDTVTYDLYYKQQTNQNTILATLDEDSSYTIIRNIKNNFYELDPDKHLTNHIYYEWFVKAKTTFGLVKRSNQHSLIFYVDNPSVPPVIPEMPRLYLYEDEDFAKGNSFWYKYFYDLDDNDETLQYDISNGRIVKVSKKDTVYYFSLPENWFGIDTLELTVIDDVGLSASSEMIIFVKSVNDPPQFDNLPDTLNLPTNKTISLLLWDYVKDVETNDKDLDYKFNVSTDSIQYSYTNSNGFLKIFSNNYNGLGFIIIKITDDSLASAQDTIFLKCGNLVNIESYASSTPKEFVLFQNYPNPFNPITKIRFGLPKTSDIEIDIFNIRGQLIHRIRKENLSGGYHEFVFDGQNLPSGVYFYRVKMGEILKVNKMVLIK